MAWPGENDFVVASVRAKKHVDELEQLTAKSLKNERRWRQDTPKLLVSSVLERLGRGELDIRAATQILSSLGTITPTERNVLLDIHGVRLSSPLELCGLILHPAGSRRALLESTFGFDVRELFVDMRLNEVPGGPDRVTALARIHADVQMAAENARLRVALALCVLHAAMQTADELRFQLEFSAGMQRTAESTFLEGVSGQQPLRLRASNIASEPLVADAASLARVRARAGIAALELLATRLPETPAGSRVDRVLRAAQLLARSLDGSTDDRFLRRWMALEALAAPGRDDVTTQIAERAAMLLFAADERPARVDWFKQMYDRRSRLAHGDVDRSPFDYTAVEFGWLVFAALEAVAARSDTDIEALYVDGT